MSVTIARAIPGHWVRTYTTTTTVTYAGGIGNAFSSTDSSDSFEYGANTNGQVGVEIDFYNESDKTIKYIEFYVTPYNNVNDPVGDSFKLKTEGPISTHSLGKKIWDYLWNNKSISSIRISEIRIEYTDGSAEVQSANRKQDSTPIRYDRSLIHTIGLPIGLCIGSLVVIALAQLINPNFVFSLIQIGLVIAFTFTAFILSRKAKNQTGTIVASIVAFVCLIGRYILRPGVMDDLPYGDIFIKLIVYTSLIGLVILSVLLILIAAGVIKKYNLRDTILSKGSIGLAIIVGLECACCFSMKGETLLYGLGVAAFAILFCFYLSAIGLRLRNNYNVQS